MMTLMISHIGKSGRILLPAFIAMLFILPYGIQAQTAGDMARESSGIFTDEVVVTAQKREQNVQDVGIAVTALTGEQMQALGYTNAQEITAMAPGVSTVQPNGEANYAIAIRGVANSDFTSNVESPIAIYVDEIYISQMSGAGFMLFDVERAEILRGPQGTLFGRNATGGLVQYVTVKPDIDGFEGYGSLTYGEFEQLKYQGAANVPLTNNMAVRVSLAGHQRQGYVENRLNPSQDLNNANDFAGRVQLLWEMDDWDLLLNFRQGRSDIRTGFFEHVTITDGARTPGTANPYLKDAEGNAGYFDNDGDPFIGDWDRTGHNDLKTEGYSATINWDVNDVRITSITDFSITERDYIEDSDASPDDFFNFFLTTDAEQISQEFRVSGERANSRWVAGLYYLDLQIDDSNGAIAHGLICSLAEAVDNFADAADAEGNPILDDDGNPTANDTDDIDFDACIARDTNDPRWGYKNPYQIDTESLSLFGQWEQDLSDTLTLIVGGRWIEEEKDLTYKHRSAEFPATATSGLDYRITFVDGSTSGFIPFYAEGAQDYTGTRDDSEWAARLQLDWKPMEDVLYYISYNRGVKSGGFNTPFLPTADFVVDAIMSYDPEQLDAFEVGFKRNWPEKGLTVNGAAYFYDYQDYQAFSVVGLDTFTLNAEAESWGFELEVMATPTPGLDLLFGAGYIDVELTDVPGITIDTPGFEALGPAIRPGEVVRPVQTPEWNLNGLLRYETDMPVLGGAVAFQLAAEYRDEHYFSLTNTESVTEDGYTLLDASLAFFPHRSENVSIHAFVKNLTDEEYLVQTFDLSGTITELSGFAGFAEHYYGKPRTWGVTLNYQF